MYNRYIPQADGSYRRNQVPEAASPERPSVSSGSGPTAERAGSFLRRLLPADLDTEDLLVILLLLLMTDDGTNDHGAALLTLAFYLFL